MRGYSKVLEFISGYLASKIGQNRAGEVATAHHSLILKRHFKRKKKANFYLSLWRQSGHDAFRLNHGSMQLTWK